MSPTSAELQGPLESSLEHVPSTLVSWCGTEGLFRSLFKGVSDIQAWAKYCGIGRPCRGAGLLWP